MLFSFLSGKDGFNSFESGGEVDVVVTFSVAEGLRSVTSGGAVAVVSLSVSFSGTFESGGAVDT